MRSKLPIFASLLLLVVVFTGVILTIHRYTTLNAATTIICLSRDPSEGTLADYQTMKSTCALVIESPATLNEAIKHSDLQHLGIRSAKELRESLTVEESEDELIIIKLKQRPGWSANDTTHALDAILGVYVDQVVNQQRLKKVEQLTNLRKRYAKTYADVVKQTEEERSLAKALGQATTGELEARRQVLDVLQKDLKSLQEKTTALETEIDKPSRLTIIQPAVFGAN